MKLNYIRPCLKWVGGKNQILDKVFQYFPKEINNYYECFAGGGSVFLELLKRLEENKININGKIIINDYNTDLINMYNIIKNNVKTLLDTLEEICQNYFDAPIKKYEKRHSVKLTNDINQMKNESKMYVYYFYRNLYNKTNDILLKSALLIFLNKTCFRGVYREGPNGFNVPYGNNINPSIFKKEHYLELSKIFNKYDVIFINKSFESVICEYKQCDFVYFDPPYYPLNSKSFTTYQKDGFGKKHNELIKLCDLLDQYNIKFLHSNSYCQFNLDNYGHFNYELLLCKRLINSKQPSDTDYEMLIFN
jgi:DNA adenine methylase